MKKNIKFFLFCIIMLISTQVKSEVKVAFIEMDKLINSSIVGASLIKQLNAIDNRNRKNFDEIKKKLNLEKKKINSQMNVLSEEEYKKKVSNLNKEFEDFKEKGKKEIQSLEKKRVIAMKKILGQINLILSKYSEENQLTFIIDQKNIIIGQTNLNVTDEILKKLNSKLKKISL
jgi:outer membrane protein